ncbi:MAG: prepilin-type cleavage/methylation domain-containing protein [Planctomycetota bacterium]
MRKARRRSGFTLLELFLTLTLAVVLMTLINAAFRFYAQDMDASDMDMRQSMLAAAIMQMIEDDLRSTLDPEPLDTTALEELLQNTVAASTGATGGNSATEGLSASGAEAAGVADPAETEPEDTTEISEGDSTVLKTPGLIGNQFQVQIDASRPPRLEEYVVLLEADPAKLLDIPSDIKTVTYYVQDPQSIGIEDPLNELDVDSTAVIDEPKGGLVRRSLDRAATNFAMIQGNLSSLSQTGELIAPEVMAIEFSYWDGTVWQIEWNSDEMGELPLAVKIAVTMSAPVTYGSSEPEPRVFTHIVRLSLAKPIADEEESTDSSEVTGI